MAARCIYSIQMNKQSNKKLWKLVVSDIGNGTQKLYRKCILLTSSFATFRKAQTACDNPVPSELHQTNISRMLLDWSTPHNRLSQLTWENSVNYPKGFQETPHCHRWDRRQNGHFPPATNSNLLLVHQTIFYRTPIPIHTRCVNFRRISHVAITQYYGVRRCQSAQIDGMIGYHSQCIKLGCPPVSKFLVCWWTQRAKSDNCNRSWCVTPKQWLCLM